MGIKSAIFGTISARCCMIQKSKKPLNRGLFPIVERFFFDKQMTGIEPDYTLHGCRNFKHFRVLWA